MIKLIDAATAKVALTLKEGQEPIEFQITSGAFRQYCVAEKLTQNQLLEKLTNDSLVCIPGVLYHAMRVSGKMQVAKAEVESFMDGLTFPEYQEAAQIVVQSITGNAKSPAATR
jgi:hypothetical protein